MYLLTKQCLEMEDGFQGDAIVIGTVWANFFFNKDIKQPSIPDKPFCLISFQMKSS